MMKKICVGAMALGMTAALAAPVSAQGSEARGEVTEHNFEDADNVEGARTGPYAVLIRSSRRPGHRTLIQPRYSFVPEMLETVEDL